MLRTILGLLLFGYLLNACPLYAQITLVQPVELRWTEGIIQQAQTDTRRIATVGFAGAYYDFDQSPLPYFGQRVLLPAGGKVTAKLRNATYLPLDLSNIALQNDIVSTFIAPQAYVCADAGKFYADITLLPIRKNEITGGYEKLLRADLELRLLPDNDQANGAEKGRSYAEHSVLGNGTFYKMRVEQTGIYRIDRNLLTALGISETVNINRLRVYGNGGGMLPELAGADKYDDLVENPIKVVDNNGNGTFDNDDYALFYAQSPHAWTYNSTYQRFEHRLNIYTDYNYYFLNFDLGAGKRVSDMAPNSAAPTDTVDTFDDYLFHELEKNNYTHSGRMFVGEEFGYTPEQTFSFSFPNIDTQKPVKIRGNFVARSVVAGTNMSYTVSVNNEAAFNTPSIGNVSGDSEGPYADSTFAGGSSMVSSPNIDVRLRFNKGNDANATGWLDYLQLNATRQLRHSTGQFSFRDTRSVGAGKTALFRFAALGSNAEIWHVSDISNIQRVAIANQQFAATAEQLREYIVFDGSNWLQPEAIGKIEAQDLHGTGTTDMVIITHPDFLAPAEQIAEFHRNADNLRVVVATTEQVYNEFASGAPDITAIRDLMKMYYDRAENPNDRPQYLLLLGDASYDYKNILFDADENQNFVPSYESSKSLQVQNTYTSDDYFGYLDDTEGTEAKMLNGMQKLDIAIGRMPALTAEEAQDMADKVIHYYSPQTMGDWRNQTVFIGDDEDSNTHINSADNHAQWVMDTQKHMNVEKIFIDAYKQETTAGGSRYPDVNKAIDRAVFKGTLLLNYEGHGGEEGWAHKNILDVAQTKKWRNVDKMPLFITATCSFGRYDNPDLTSIGELIVKQPKSGAIAALTTSRLVYSGANATLNQNALNHLFDFVDGKPHTIGEVFRLAKNDVTSTFAQPNENMHKFNLLGDPALRLPLPTQNAVLTTLNGQDFAHADTIKALSTVTLQGEVQDQNDQLIADFDGTATVTIYDKIITTATLRNDPANSPPFDFKQRKGLLFRGKATVTDGKFSITFIAPRDLMLNYGSGRVSVYAENGNIDASGYTESVIVGGIADNVIPDNEPPQVSVFINDELFKSGSKTNENPILHVRLYDDNGISTTGSAVGHDLTAILDDNAQQTYLLNEYYEADPNSYQTGIARYPLYQLSEGWHRIEVKAWDVHNNSGKGFTEFVVAQNAQLALYEVLNFPNPMTDYTAFALEHNSPNETLDVAIEIVSLSGQLVKTIRQQIVPTGFRSTDITWDGLNGLGSPVGRGMYVYRVTISNPTNGQSAYKSEKLVIIR
ncbi:MAG: type IX secretion system sortase PorU [Sphingobacteriales bacterium]|nr:type IX secretion system sortase PorU [Sphingobacteriales bacterium]